MLQSLSLSPTTASNTPTTTARPLHTTPSNRWFWNRNKSKKSSSETSLEQQVTGSAEARKALMERLSKRTEGPAIFEDEVKDAAAASSSAADRAAAGGAPPPGAALRSGAYTSAGASLVREHLARDADPDPRSRARWERKMVVRAVRRATNPYSREPRAERIARTERQLTSRSPWLATSVKKLVKLAHQIQGKTVAEALVQMRYSKKKMAQEVRYQLELARDLAVAERGMGLGAVNAANAAEGDEKKAPAELIEIRTKDGRFVKIDDPTRIYVAEAWVNRGPWRARELIYCSRGRTNIKNRPSTGEYSPFFPVSILCPRFLTNAPPRHLGRAQGGKDADTRACRA